MLLDAKDGVLQIPPGPPLRGGSTCHRRGRVNVGCHANRSHGCGHCVRGAPRRPRSKRMCPTGGVFWEAHTPRRNLVSRVGNACRFAGCDRRDAASSVLQIRPVFTTTCVHRLARSRTPNRIRIPGARHSRRASALRGSSPAANVAMRRPRYCKYAGLHTDLRPPPRSVSFSEPHTHFRRTTPRRARTVGVRSVDTSQIAQLTG